MGPRNRAVMQPQAWRALWMLLKLGWRDRWVLACILWGGGSEEWVLLCLGNQERNAGFPRRAVSVSESELFSGGSSLGH